MTLQLRNRLGNERLMPLRQGHAGLLLSLAVCGIVACSAGAGGPDQEIRAVLASAELAAEAGNFAEIAVLIDPGYRDARGNDRLALIRFLRTQVLRSEHRALRTEVQHIETHGDSAADVALTIGFSPAGAGLVLLDGQHYAVNLELIRADNGTWSVIGARWGRAGGTAR